MILKSLPFGDLSKSFLYKLHNLRTFIKGVKLYIFANNIIIMYTLIKCVKANEFCMNRNYLFFFNIKTVFFLSLTNDKCLRKITIFRFLQFHFSFWKTMHSIIATVPVFAIPSVFLFHKYIYASSVMENMHNKYSNSLFTMYFCNIHSTKPLSVPCFK